MTEIGDSAGRSLAVIDSVTPKPPSALARYYRHRAHTARRTGLRLWIWLIRRTHGYARYLAQAIDNFRKRGVAEATIFGYWSMFSLFPLVMLATVIATFVFGNEHGREQVSAALGQFIPGGGSVLISDTINSVLSIRGPFSIFGIVSLIYGSTGLFMNLQWSLSRIFRDNQQRIWPLQLVIGVIMILILGI